jgi:hypothetical protein
MDTNKRKTQKHARRRWQTRWLLSLAIIAVAGLALIPVLQAVHDTGRFELEGNVVTDNPAPSHDWDKVYADFQTGFTQNTAQSTASSFVPEPNPSASIFTGGGSKDPIDLNQWLWKDAGGLPDKDNLTNAFAVRYSLPKDPVHCPAPSTSTTCEVLFFGSDRFDNSGDAQQGFWFFQNPVGVSYDSNGDGTLDTNCPASGGSSFTFCNPTDGSPATHRNGDLLVISDFSNGGTVSTINVYQWLNGGLVGITGSTSAKCGPSRGDGDGFCGVVNPANGTFTPWPYTDKSGNHTYLQGELYEGGVNLSALGLGGECFSSVAAETRSSTSTTATLKDFVIGNFGKCETDFATTPQAKTDEAGATFNNVGTAPENDVEIPLDGTLTVRDHFTLTVSGSPSWQGSIQFTLCAPGDLAPTAGKPATCTAGGTAIGSPVAVGDAGDQQSGNSPEATITSAGKYCWRGVFTPTTQGVPSKTDARASECFVVNPVQPGLITSASGPVTIGQAITDTATLSLTANRPGSPVINPTIAGAVAGGSITFRLYGPSDTAVCNDQNLVFTSNPATAVTGNNTYGPVSFTPTAAGTYRWIASYTGDLPNTLSANGSCGDSNETSVVNPKQPTISTTATAPPPDGLPLTSEISDSALLGNTQTPSNGVFGTITFRAYGPFDAVKICTGTAVYTSVVTINGNGTFSSTAGDGGPFVPTDPGYYNWIASYAPSNGDVNNLPVSGACTDNSEASLLISLNPTIATSQWFYPNDTATVTVAQGGGNLAGSVHFQLFTTSDCSNAAIVDQTVPLAAGAGLTKTADTTNVTVKVTGSASLYWKVDYSSTNPAHKSVTGACGKERSVITVDNNFTPPTP